MRPFLYWECFSDQPDKRIRLRRAILHRLVEFQMREHVEGRPADKLVESVFHEFVSDLAGVHVPDEPDSSNVSDLIDSIDRELVAAHEFEDYVFDVKSYHQAVTRFLHGTDGGFR